MNKVVNDFSIIVGTKNGSGSSTANNTILRAIFKMGIPVSGKNLFPSNIQGLPTWYTIRVNKEGFIGRREEQEILVGRDKITGCPLAAVNEGRPVVTPQCPAGANREQSPLHVEPDAPPMTETLLRQSHMHRTNPNRHEAGAHILSTSSRSPLR